MWSTFKSNEGDARVITPQGNVANIDIPALVALKALLDRKLIESGWWHDASLRIDATVGASLAIDAPALRSMKGHRLLNIRSPICAILAFVKWMILSPSVWAAPK